MNKYKRNKLKRKKKKKKKVRKNNKSYCKRKNKSLKIRK